MFDFVIELSYAKHPELPEDRPSELSLAAIGERNNWQSAHYTQLERKIKSGQFLAFDQYQCETKNIDSQTAIKRTDAAAYVAQVGLSLAGYAPASPVPSANIPTKESAQARDARRYQMCLDAGLVMPELDYGPMPRGIGKIAEREGITRQSFTQSVERHINRTWPARSN